MADFTTNTTVDTSTIYKIMAKAIDIVTSYSPVTLHFLKNQKRWDWGEQAQIPIKYQQNNQGMSFDGLEQFSTTKVNNFQKMKFNPTGYEIPVVISGFELDVNKSKPIVDIVKRQVASDAQDMASDIADQFFTLQTGKAFNSLLDICDDTSLGTTSYGSLSRTTYTGLRGNYTGSIGNITLAQLTSSINNATHGNQTPDLIVTTKAIWGYIEKLYLPTISNQVATMRFSGYPNYVGASNDGTPSILGAGSPLKGSHGFRALEYGGVPIVADEKCPTGYLFGLNTKGISFYGLESTLPGYKSVQFSDDSLDGANNVPIVPGFAFSGFNLPIDQYAEVGHIILKGQLIGENPRNNFLLTGITGS